MDKPLHPIDHHFNLPVIRRVDAGRPFAWLAAGWGDFRASLGASLAYGAFFALAGYLVLSYAAGLPYLFTAAI